jgi:phosphatidylserine/phosphatidylglycerophosphate/cardiolipin synthase-like enzyme
MNAALRRALDEAEVDEADLAEQVGVDPRTVLRWIAGRQPYRRHRTAVARILNVDEGDLWPLTTRPNMTPHPPNEILAAYPHRWSVPRAVWLALFQHAREEIDILAYAGLFLAEDSGVLRTIAARAGQGVRVRIALGDPDSPKVATRGADEGVGDSLSAKIHNALVRYRALLDAQDVEIRLHDTILYNSIYRADDQLLINPHAYGISASDAPVLHIRRVGDEDMASTYMGSFERVWTAARSLG